MATYRKLNGVIQEVCPGCLGTGKYVAPDSHSAGRVLMPSHEVCLQCQGTGVPAAHDRAVSMIAE